jgi:hypothetical protein
MNKRLYLAVSLLIALASGCMRGSHRSPACHRRAVEAPAAAANPGLQMESANVAPQF